MHDERRDFADAQDDQRSTRPTQASSRVMQGPSNRTLRSRLPQVVRYRERDSGSGSNIFFDTFKLAYIDVDDVVLRTRYGGQGPAVLLLHGHPRTHATWHKVAPLLAQHFTVVILICGATGNRASPRRPLITRLIRNGRWPGDPASIWREWGQEVRGVEIDSGHHIGEEAPEALATELHRFLRP